MRTDEEFHEDAVPVVGSCVAGRVWCAWPDGALTGVTYRQEWKVTGNAAYCPYIGLALTDHADVPTGWRNGIFGTFVNHARSRRSRHLPGALGCCCGWWSYHDSTLSGSWSPSASGTAVVGVIHAYGLLTRGSKGYRSQYADIAAFVRPKWADVTINDDEMKPSVDLWQRVLERYPAPVYDSINDAFRHAARSAA